MHSLHRIDVQHNIVVMAYGSKLAYLGEKDAHVIVSAANPQGRVKRTGQEKPKSLLFLLPGYLQLGEK